MEWKKTATLILGLLLIGMTIGAGSVSATTATSGEATVTVILVSDNAADSCVAKLLANATGGIIVTTPWGVYDPNVTAEILGYAPDRVIIIGGPMAVVEQYVTDLEDYNITVYRWGGVNRYETNLIALQMARSKGLLKKDNVTVFAPGNDTAAIEQAVEIALKEGGVVVYVNKTVSIDKINKTVSIKKVIIVHSPVTKGIAKGVMKKLFSLNATAVDVTVNVNSTVQFIEKVIQLRIDRIRYIANLTNSSELFKLADSLAAQLQQVNELIRAGNVTEAYQKLLWLQVRSQFAVERANFIMVKEMLTGKVGVMIKLMKLKAELQILQSAGINVTEYNQTLEQVEKYLKEGNDGMALKLLNQLEKELWGIYKMNRILLREHMRKVHRRGHGHWWHGGSNETANQTLGNQTSGWGNH